MDDILLRAEPAVTEKFWQDINEDLGLKGWGYITAGYMAGVYHGGTAAATGLGSRLRR